MKKLLFLAMTALCMLACDTNEPNTPNGSNDPNNPNDSIVPAKITSISIKADFETIEQGKQQALRITYSPAEAEAPTVTWSSSDTTTLKVTENGLVTGVKVGTARITATYNDLKDEIDLEVIDSYVAFSVAYQYVLNISTDPISDEIVSIPLIDGTTENCRLHRGVFLFTDENITPGADNYFHGAGFCIIASAPLYVITGGTYNGYHIGGGVEFSSDPLYADTPYVAMVGKIAKEDVYKDFWITGDLSEAAQEAYFDAEPLTGSWIQVIDFDGGGATFELAAVGESIIDGSNSNPDETFYKLNVSWLDGYHGLKATEEGVDEDGNPILAPVVPVELLPFIERYYEKLPEEEAAAVRSQALPHVFRSNPQIANMRANTKVLYRR